ncbi:MAG TPA: bifunctional phosphoribosyl-AMP cyclohydrolase/phosphoribosyl-ATP diphosphatase HisIE [Blastocatellia bacterium]|nr:bifunctional phosphoribosyl-AMP cyclohydrolase/phosphoribosyl-ATP diphosphatase HisIE [Blastocatellia bacterium]
MSELPIDNLKFNEQGLIPAIVQDAATREVLMLAWMNETSLRLTLESGETWFWSRSRQALWHKGATSGHTQRVVGITLDCDGDTLVIAVNPNGPACHTGARSCFFTGLNGEAAGGVTTGEPSLIAPPPAPQIERPGAQLSVVDVSAMELGILLQDLFRLIQERREQRPENSYTSYLFDKGLDKILKKIGEEAAETIIAAKNEGTKELSAEITDLLYHLLVLMVERGVSLPDIMGELSQRAGRPAGPKYRQNER